jgi:hypothetical protein
MNPVRTGEAASVIDFPLAGLPMMLAGVGGLLRKGWGLKIMIWLGLLGVAMSPFLWGLIHGDLQVGLLLDPETLVPMTILLVYSRPEIRVLYR